MKPSDRYDWIETYIEEGRGKPVSIVDRHFVDAYIAATKAPYTPTNFGAYKCPQLSRDLSEMYKRYRLRRYSTGIQGMGGMGFPTWVWSYRQGHSS
jgi:hypothetical protein